MEKRVAVVTGAARGIGYAIAERLARERFTVAVADIAGKDARLASARISNCTGGEAFAIQVDVADPLSVHAMVEAVLGKSGRIDVLVNNAGIGGPVGPVVSYPAEGWQRVLAVNLNGVFLCSKAVLPDMLARGSGRIVNIASISGKEGNPTMSAYSTSKAGVIGFTKALAKEVATQGINVNCVTPAVIESVFDN